MNKQEFSQRLAALRINKGVSARDMSLSIGQSAGYINNIENGINLPSMQAFFYICEYLEITPKEFFDTDTVGYDDDFRINRSCQGTEQQPAPQPDQPCQGTQVNIYKSSRPWDEV